MFLKMSVLKNSFDVSVEHDVANIRYRTYIYIYIYVGGRGVHRVLVGKPEGKKTTGETQT